MKQVIKDEELGEIVYDENAWTGRKSISVNGEALEKASKKEFLLPDGNKAVVTGNFIMGAKLLIGGRTIKLTPAVKWYEIVLCLIPFVLILVWGNSVTLCSIIPVVGGAIGGAISGIFSVLSLYVMKTVQPVWQKILIGVAAIAVTFGVCCGIGFAIVAIATR